MPRASRHRRRQALRSRRSSARTPTTSSGSTSERPPRTNPIQVQNVGTGQCMDASAFSNAAPVVQVPCGVQATGSYWNRNTLTGLNDPVQGYQFKTNSANYCLDLENGWATLGMSMQVWQCNPRTHNQDWDIFVPL